MYLVFIEKENTKKSVCPAFQEISSMLSLDSLVGRSHSSGHRALRLLFIAVFILYFVAIRNINDEQTTKRMPTGKPNKKISVDEKKSMSKNRIEECRAVKNIYIDISKWHGNEGRFPWNPFGAFRSFCSMLDVNSAGTADKHHPHRMWRLSLSARCWSETVSCP